jgi:threonine synthase
MVTLNYPGRAHKGKFSYFSSLICSNCSTVYAGEETQTVCRNPDCKATLLASYDLSAPVSKEDLRNRTNSMWRFREFLPVVNERNVITMGEGGTPLFRAEKLGARIGLPDLWWKDESGNPTGSFKARGMSAAVSKAKELGIAKAAVPTAGNAGVALAAYGATAGMEVHVFMPRETPDYLKRECLYYGAHLNEIEGNIGDCGKLVADLSPLNGWFNFSTLKEPYRLEGKKTMGYELAEQFNWELPDVILYPTGGGTGLIGFWKAFEELEQLGWIGSKRPRLISVQSDCCDAIVTAFEQNKPESEYVDKGFTIASGLRVPKPYADRLILKILRDTQGSAIRIADQEIGMALNEIARVEGLFVAPEGAALWAALKKLKAENVIHEHERIVMVNTGSGAAMSGTI